MQTYTFLTVLLLFGFTANSQENNDTSYEQAIQFYHDKKYDSAAIIFEKILLNESMNNASNNYDAGCSWAQAGNANKAFYYLTNAAHKGYSNLSHIKMDKDLLLLHSDARWQGLVELITANYLKKNPSYNVQVANQLEEVFHRENKYRVILDSVVKANGWESSQAKIFSDSVRYTDSINLKIVQQIIEEHGWLGVETVGTIGNVALFMVIQHSGIEIQKRYFPLMEKAAKEDKLEKSHLALLEDRIRMKEGKKQIYGSQLKWNEKKKINEFYPIEDEKNVNIRRQEVGLEPIESYAKKFGINYESKK